MRRHARRAAVLLGAWLALAACGGLPLLGGGHQAGTGRGPVKVALVDVFSGTSGYAYLGPYLQDSLQVQLNELNARGGLLGSQVQLVTADDQYSVTQTPAVVRQLLSDRSVRLLVGPSFAGLYLGAKPLVERAAVPNCLTSMDADDVMQSAPYSFREQAPAQARVPALLSYLQKSTLVKKVGLVTDQDSVGTGYDQQLSDQAGRYGLQYIGAAFVTGPGDQKAQLQQMVQRGLDAVVLSNNPATATRTLQAIAQLKTAPKPKAFGFDGLASYAFAQQTGDAANGVTFTSGILDYLSDVPQARWPSFYRDFASRVLGQFGTAPNGVEMKGVPGAPDCILQWSRAVQAAGAFDGAKVAAAWAALDIPAAQSVLGVHEQFSPADHDAVAPTSMFIYQWTKTGDHWGVKQLAGPPA